MRMCGRALTVAHAASRALSRARWLAHASCGPRAAGASRWAATVLVICMSMRGGRTRQGCGRSCRIVRITFAEPQALTAPLRDLNGASPQVAGLAKLLAQDAAEGDATRRRILLLDLRGEDCFAACHINGGAQA